LLFNTLAFFQFLALVLGGFYLLPLALRKYWLLAASYYFYGSWNVKFLWLLGGVTALDYAAGLWVASSEGRRRKIGLIVSLAANLSVLGFFKYFHFITGHRFDFDIVLPIGISFHIFQSMSYVVDVYRREQEAVRNPIDYALFLAFFPQLVAGPIVRAKVFFADLYPWSRPSAKDVSRGAFLLVLGLTKKMAFADNFAKISDAYFSAATPSGGILDAWTATIAFGLQIYFDFSGYTDMAIGMAKLLGFHFPVNFRRPYLASSITDFWRRWHISLSTWLRDYLYIPLGGNRNHTYRNLMLTMLLGGLWHGASWNFVIWGGYHGALLALERALGLGEPRWRLIRTPITFALVMIGWVFFRAQTFDSAWATLKLLFAGPLGKSLFEPWHWGLFAVAAIYALIEEWRDKEDLSPVAYALLLGLMLFVLEIFAVTDVEIPFVYFQF
jgi:alginate O-acetyltransferase complex protein AlgI